MYADPRVRASEPESQSAGLGYAQMTSPRSPQRDSLPESPVDYVDIPLGPGQEPNIRGHLQFTREGDAIHGTDVRRTPGYESIPVVHRPPQAPA